MMAGKGASATSTGTSPAGADVLRSPYGGEPFNRAAMADPAASVASSSGPGMDWQKFFAEQMKNQQGSLSPSDVPMASPVPVGPAPAVENLRALRFAPYTGERPKTSEVVAQFLRQMQGAR